MTKASNGSSPGPVANFFWSKLTLDFEGVNNIRKTDLTFPLSRLSNSRLSSIVSPKESLSPSENCFSHLVRENNTRSIKELVPRNETSDGLRSIRWVKPKVPLSTNEPLESFLSGNTDRWTFSGEKILKNFSKNSLLWPRTTAELDVSYLCIVSWNTSFGIWKRKKKRAKRFKLHQKSACTQLTTKYTWEDHKAL